MRAIPDPTHEPLDYLRLISRDLRQLGHSALANETLDAICSLRREREELLAEVRAYRDELQGFGLQDGPVFRRVDALVTRIEGGAS